MSEKIQQLLDSNKSPDEVEKEATRIISEQLFNYRIEELKNDFLFPEEAEEAEPMEILKLNEKNLDKNFTDFTERLKQEKTLDFISALKEQCPSANFYLVGGTVRDGLLGKIGKDYDLVISGAPQEELEKQLKQIGKVDLVGKNFGVYKLYYNGEIVDIALPRTEKSFGSGRKADFAITSSHELPIEDDLSRRDLTMNAMALNLVNQQLVDPFNGKQDLLNGEIKAVGNPMDRFNEDISRTLRAIRFACKMNFSIEKQTWQAISEKMSEILKQDENGQIIAWETIGEEIKKSFSANPTKALELLDKSGGLKLIFPEVERLKGVPQPAKHHKEGDAYNHTKLILKALPPTAPACLIFGALLHDIGKADTTAPDENGEIHSFGHTEKGAEMAKEICQRLRFTNDLTEKIVLLVDKHMDLFQIEKMKPATIHKLLFQDISKELLHIHKADLMATLNPDDALRYYHTAIDWIKKFQAEQKTEIKPLITGKDLIALGLKPGPTFKQILSRSLELQIEGVLQSKDEAIKFIKEEFLETINN